ncbi:glycosyltransferase 61 family protein, partial [Szabonella alba]
MRKTAFPEEIAAEAGPAGPGDIPRPRVSSLQHLPLSSRRVMRPPRQILHLEAALVPAGRAICRTARGDWLALTAGEADQPPPQENPAIREVPAAIAGTGGRADQELAKAGLAKAGLAAGERSAWTGFLTGTLPRILLAARMAPAGTPVLVDADLPPVCRAALGLCLPGHPLRDLVPGEQLRIGRLYAALTGDPEDLTLSPADMNLLSGLRAAGTGRAAAGERLLLWSSETARTLRNATPLRHALEARGCVTLDMTGMALPERIAALRSARAVVLADPALLGDALLAPGGAQMFALLPEGTDLHRWSLAGQLGGHRMTVVLGSARYHRLRRRFLPHGLRGEQVFHVDPHLILPFLPAPPAPPQDLSPTALLDALYGASFEADVLTGAWAVHAGPTPAGFEDRLRALRGQAARRLAEAPEAEISAVSGHAFFADFARNIRSGFPVLAGFTAWEAAAAEQLRRSFAGQEAGEGPLAAAALTGAAG